MFFEKLNFVSLLFLFALNITYSKTFYVDSNRGKDSNSGTSTSAPWNSISKINSLRFNGGDTISFRGGNRFILTSNFQPQGTNLTFNSYGTGTRPVIDGVNTYWTQLGWPNTSGQNYITFNGIKFVHGLGVNVELEGTDHIIFESCNLDSSGGGIYAGGAAGGGYLTVRYSTLSFNRESSNGHDQHGIYISGVDNTLLEHDTLSYNIHCGVRVGFGDDNHGTDNLVVRYCVMRFNDGYAHVNDGMTSSYFYYNLCETSLPDGLTPWCADVYVYQGITSNASAPPPRDCYYYNNTFIAHGPNQMFIQAGDNDASTLYPDGNPYYNSTNIVFKNNIFYHTDAASDVGVRFYGSTIRPNWIFDNNLYYGLKSSWYLGGARKFSYWQNILNFDTHGLNKNPLFTKYAAGDYSLSIKSPAIKSGTYVALTTDINGNAVPNPPDMGAFQNLPLH